MGYIALYRRFRPETFSEIAGQHALVETLKNQVHAGHISHAYLFCGPRGVGKTTAARIFARAINCEKPEGGEACGKCPGCRSFEAQSTMDIIEIDAASNNGVDNIRDLRENTRFMPASSKYRVYIIDEVHMLSKQAFNALLKTLEEPPAHIVFIMATTEPHKLPVTVLSRCQRFDFKRLSAKDIVEQLVKICSQADIRVEDKALSYIARAATGGMRDAISLLDQCAALGKQPIDMRDVAAMLGAADSSLYFALAEAMLQGDLKRALAGLHHMMETGCDPARVAADMLAHFRDLFVAMHAADLSAALPVDDATAARYRAQSAKAASASLIRFMDLFARLEGDLRFAGSPRTWLELTIGKCCLAESPNAYEALLERVQKLETAFAHAAVPAAAKGTETLAVKPEPVREEEFFPVTDQDIRSYPENPPVMLEEIPLGEQELPSAFTAQTKPAGQHKEPPVKQQQKKEEPAEPADCGDGRGNAKNLWKGAIKRMEERGLMSAATAMKKGRAVAFEQGALSVLFPPDAHTSIDRLGEDAVKTKLAAVLRELCGGSVILSMGVEKLNDREKKTIDRLSNDFPGVDIEIKYDDD